MQPPPGGQLIDMYLLKYVAGALVCRQVGSLTQVSKAKVGQVLKPRMTQMDLGIETQRWVWVPILGLEIKTLKDQQREAVQECLLLCTRKNRSLCLERGGVPVRGREEEIPPPHSITDEVLSCSLQVLP